ncbi:MAG: hypothetical protein ACOH12_02075 [Parvibaculaceae bacterium]
MAQATVTRMKKGAHRFAMQTHAFIRLSGYRFRVHHADCVLFLTGLVTSVVHHPSVRRSRLRRDLIRLRRVLMASGDYNFDDFYRTQYGLGVSPDEVSSADFDRLPSATLLEKAYSLTDDARSAAATRVLVQRAVVKATAREAAGQAAAVYAPKAHDPSIHHQWRDAIEAAFAPGATGQGPEAERPVVVGIRRPKASNKADKMVDIPFWQRPVPLMVADNEAFERSVPQAVTYRASTRH